MLEILNNIRKTCDLDDNFRVAWIQLALSKNVGPFTFLELLKTFETPEKALKGIPDLSRNVTSKGGDGIISKKYVLNMLDKLGKMDATVILPYDPIYPELLLEISSPPPFLVAKGDLTLLSRPKVAIVGARQASTNGLEFTKKISRDLAKSGFVIVSGLASGIDTAAHTSSIEYGTIGVIGSGIDYIYPQENTALYKDMYRRGLILTEYPLGYQPIAKSFPQRNRIISGLSYGVVITEAAKRSGTLITVRFALEQGREVFAVPGSPLDQRYQGTNALIKQGAILLESAEDVIYELQNIINNKKNVLMDNDIYEQSSIIRKSNALEQKISGADLEHFRKKILERLTYSYTTQESVIKDLKIPVDIFNIIILELELAGKIERNYLNQICLLASF